ncbi:MAG: sigma-54 dependent transcriptional regulator, partial [Pseudomonadales bacterium]|nr:sigma-54 dependent transcriptional regulator [Pseudomonadales bacterium]
LLEKQKVNMVVSDVNMGGISGHELLERLQHIYPALPVLLMTAYGDVSSAVNAMRSGAVDYLVKPFKPQALVEAVARYATGKCNQQDQSLPIADEPSSQALLQLAQRVAATDSTVLISGESGTGKEVLARYIHTHSSRTEGPFVAINCAAIPENMLEATLFGHEKGAFTGAYTSNPGKFEQANGGTILLDEVSEMDMGLQAKLLRVLQEREVERVGGKKVITLDVRIIATTNRELLEYVAAGKFREDLYYRLSVFPLQWLPLRERRLDIVPLAERLIQQHCRKMNKDRVSLTAEAKEKLCTYSWPGNVRELDNVIQRALILQQGERIHAADLMLTPSPRQVEMEAKNATDKSPEETGEALSGLGDGMKNHEYQLIVEALTVERGRKKQAAEKLGISPRTLRYKLAKMRESGFDLEAALGF